jgi:hypothetical protein
MARPHWTFRDTHIQAGSLWDELRIPQFLWSSETSIPKLNLSGMADTMCVLARYSEIP